MKIYNSFFLFLVVATLLFLNCSSLSIYKDLYSSDIEKQILDETTKSIDYNYGFDEEFEIVYFYFDSFKAKESVWKNKKFFEVTKKYKLKQLIPFYEKIYKLKVITEYHLNNFKKDEDWKEYLYFRDYLLPPLERYANLLKKVLIRRSWSYKKKIKTRQKELEAEAKEEL